MFDSFFFFQAEDGIRGLYVTGVQTCALPICGRGRHREISRDAIVAVGEGLGPAQQRADAIGKAGHAWRTLHGCTRATRREAMLQSLARSTGLRRYASKPMT